MRCAPTGHTAPPWSVDKVRAHIRSLSGTHFEPEVVAVFLEQLPRLRDVPQ